MSVGGATGVSSLLQPPFTQTASINHRKRIFGLLGMHPVEKNP
jgi:hypothetical protein